MAKYTKEELEQLRNYSIVKSNDLILKSRFSLTVQQQRVILYLVSKIKKDDTEFTEYSFSIREFGEVCGIDTTGGKERDALKSVLKIIADKSLYITIGEEESLLRWINTIKINRNVGIIKVKLHESMMPYLLQLQNKYLDYKLYYVLAMKSQYGTRLYEILKAEYNKTVKVRAKRMDTSEVLEYDITLLKKMTATDKYTRYSDFKNRVLEAAKNDINLYSDLMVDYEPIKDGKAFTKIKFSVRYKTHKQDGYDVFNNIENQLNGRRKSALTIPSGNFCDDCKLNVDGVCSTAPKCVMCNGDIEGQLSLLE